MTEKKFFKALFKTVLFFAFFHLILLFVLAIVNTRIVYLNVFEIVGLSHFFPGIEKGLLSFFLSIVVILVTYFVFYKRQK